MKKHFITRASALALFASSSVLNAAILDTGAGDGSVIIDVDGYGNSSSAIFDPLGPVGAADTFYESGVFIPTAGGRSVIGGVFEDIIPEEGGEFDGPVEIAGSPAGEFTVISQTATEFVTSFSVGALDVLLTQTLVDSVETGIVTGSLFTQAYQVTNTGVDASFDIIRYLDGDLDFDGELDDSGGILSVAGSQILFEIEADNVPGSDTTFVGIAATVSGDNLSPNAGVQNYEMNEYSTLLDDIQGGFDLRNVIEGDLDSDGFIDGTYDVTMALQNFVTIPNGGTVTYTTATLFGNAVPPAPGEIEALPLLPDDVNPEGGFEFELLADDIVPGRIIWIDPIIATGYTYEVTGAAFGSVQLPSFATVPDSDYTVLVGGNSYAVTSGQILDFTTLFATPIYTFQIVGIDQSLALDPLNPGAFNTGISVVDVVSASVLVTQTPITFDTGPAAVPLPAAFWLLLSAVGGLVLVRRRHTPALLAA